MDRYQCIVLYTLTVRFLRLFYPKLFSEILQRNGLLIFALQFLNLPLESLSEYLNLRKLLSLPVLVLRMCVVYSICLFGCSLRRV